MPSSISSFERHGFLRQTASDFPTTDEGVEQVRKELAGHQTTKELLKVRYDEPLPEDLIRRIAEHRLRVVKAREDDSCW